MYYHTSYWPNSAYLFELVKAEKRDEIIAYLSNIDVLDEAEKYAADVNENDSAVEWAMRVNNFELAYMLARHGAVPCKYADERLVETCHEIFDDEVDRITMICDMQELEKSISKIKTESERVDELSKMFTDLTY